MQGQSRRKIACKNTLNINKNTYLRFLHKNADRILVCILVPQRALAVLDTTLHLRRLSFRRHKRLELRQP